jgi:hypothetical protein
MRSYFLSNARLEFLHLEYSNHEMFIYFNAILLRLNICQIKVTMETLVKIASQIWIQEHY